MFTITVIGAIASAFNMAGAIASLNYHSALGWFAATVWSVSAVFGLLCGR